MSLSPRSPESPVFFLKPFQGVEPGKVFPINRLGRRRIIGRLFEENREAFPHPERRLGDEGPKELDQGLVVEGFLKSDGFRRIGYKFALFLVRVMEIDEVVPRLTKDSPQVLVVPFFTGEDAHFEFRF